MVNVHRGVQVRGVGLGGQGGCEQRIEVFVKKGRGRGAGGSGWRVSVGGSGWMCRLGGKGGCEQFKFL